MTTQRKPRITSAEVVAELRSVYADARLFKEQAHLAAVDALEKRMQLVAVVAFGVGALVGGLIVGAVMSNY